MRRVVVLLLWLFCAWPVASFCGAPAAAKDIKSLELKPNDIVQWLGRDGKTYLILNIFTHADALAGMAEADRNDALINTGLVQGALRFGKPENSAVGEFNLLLISLRDMSEYGSGGGWKQLGAGLLVRGADKVELRDAKFDGALPSPLPTVPYPYKESSTVASAADVRFRMPEKLYLVAGQAQAFFYENLVVSKDIEDFQYVPTGDAVGFATYLRRGLSFLAKPADVGEHDLAIKVTDWEGHFVAEGKTKVVVSPAAAGAQTNGGDPVRVLIIGHSLPSMYYPGYLANYLAAPGNPKISFVGGIKYWYGKLPDFENNPDTDSMRHQASPGYSLNTVLNLYTDQPPANPNMPSKSPFIYKDGDAPPKFDIKRYFRESLGSQEPHFILLNIGDNDTFDFDPDNPDPAAETQFRSNANKFLDELRSIAPKATFGAIMPNTYNYSDRSFAVNYGPHYPRWKQLQNRARYIELMTEVAKQRGDFEIIPSNYSVDSVDGMPYNSGTHFNALGARQFAGSIYAWMKGAFVLRGTGAQGEAQAPAAPAAPVTTAATPASPAPAAPAAAAPSAQVVANPAPQPVAAAAVPAAPPLKLDWFQKLKRSVTAALTFD